MTGSPDAVPRVSVVMSVYNGGEHLRECVSSVLTQTLSNFEFLIIDDGSTDRSRSILEGFNDPRLRILVNETNIGLTRSLNRGLREAKGDYIARIDADDICMPTRLERQARFLDRHPTCVAVGSAIATIDERGRITGGALKPLGDRELKFMTLFYSPFFHPSVMFRRRTAGEPVLYDEALETTQDYALWGQLSGIGEFRNIPECLVKVRSRPDSITVRRREKQIAVHKAISRRLIDGRVGDTGEAGLAAMYETILTENPLSFTRGRLAARTMWMLAHAWVSTDARVSERPRAIVAEFLFNHLLRKRRRGNGILAFCGAFVETRGGILFHLAWRLRSMVQRFVASRRYGGLTGAS